MFIFKVPLYFLSYEKGIYLILAFAGLVIPFSQFLSFLIENGLNVSLIFNQIVGYRISTFAWLDLIVSPIVVIVMVWNEIDRLTPWWLQVIATLLIGPSCGLPLYMYLSE
jgi:hypothetical protein